MKKNYTRKSEYVPREQVMSAKDTEREYAKLIRSVKEDPFFKDIKIGRVNCYVCKACSHITKTKEVDPGVTPFMHTCENCQSMAMSSFYNDVAPELKPTQEWYRPTLKQVLKVRRHPALLDHVLKGGLINRKINEAS